MVFFSLAVVNLLSTLFLVREGPLGRLRGMPHVMQLQAEVYAREQHEIVQEIGIRQSENTRSSRAMHTESYFRPVLLFRRTVLEFAVVGRG